MDDTVTLGGRLQRLREARGDSTRKVASGAGMARTTYERRELEPDNLTYRELRNLARFYGVTVADLVEPADAELTTVKAKAGAPAA